jgi:hypothetical protein
MWGGSVSRSRVVLDAALRRTVAYPGLSRDFVSRQESGGLSGRRPTMAPRTKVARAWAGSVSFSVLVAAR